MFVDSISIYFVIFISPGGGRVWPTSSYWSPNERTIPIKCINPLACPGIDVSSLSSKSASISGARDTQLCSLGYDGTTCSICSSNYYQVGLLCLPCGTQSTARLEFILTILGCLLIYVLLSIAVAFGSTRLLSTIVGLFIGLQQFVQLGKSAINSKLGDITWLVQAFNTISVINFDLQFFKPGKTS